jgi:nicotinamide-nucleotide amidase
MKILNFDIITIGNELLIGKILNTNMQFLAKAVTDLGGSVVRVTTVRDDVGEIVTAVKEAFDRETDFVITCGGLGPTFDDKTMEAISKAVEKPLVLNRTALEYMKKGHRLRHVGKTGVYELTPSRLKMAMLPQGSTPLFNPHGSASGVYLKNKGIRVVVLPGVPDEMQRIFVERVGPIIKDLVGDFFRREESLFARDIPESRVAPLIDEVMSEHPLVYIKSHPKREPEPMLELHFSTVSEKEEVADEDLVNEIDSSHRR